MVTTYQAIWSAFTERIGADRASLDMVMSIVEDTEPMKEPFKNR